MTFFNDDLLLHDLDKMLTKTTSFVPLSVGYTPMNRPIDDYLSSSVVFLDKPQNPSSHEVVSWVRRIVGCSKTGHGGTLDPSVSGALLVCLDRATRLTKVMQSDTKTYVCKMTFDKQIEKKEVMIAVQKLTGNIFQRPPLISAVKKQLRLRQIYRIDILEIIGNDCLFEVECEAGTYVRTLCVHFGIYLGKKATMSELRRIKSGMIKESMLVTMHDLMDVIYQFRENNDPSYLKRVFFPLESILVGYKRIMVKDSCVGAICAGAQLSIQGVVKYDKNIEIKDKLVIITTKGEAVSIATALISYVEIGILDHGIVCKTKRVIMEKGLYPETWSIKKKYELE